VRDRHDSSGIDESLSSGGMGDHQSDPCSELPTQPNNDQLTISPLRSGKRADGSTDSDVIKHQIEDEFLDNQDEAP